MKWFFLLACFVSSSVFATDLPEGAQPFYSNEGREHNVTFDALYRSTYTTVADVKALSESDKQSLVQYRIEPLMKYLFGPLTNRGIASPQRGTQITVEWQNPRLENGRVLLPYRYKATWILQKDWAAKGNFSLPVPFEEKPLYSANWKNCTDSAPDHQTRDFYWYFWDPERSGCDHQLNREYLEVSINIGSQTANSNETFPEYSKLLSANGEANALHMTFGFGYVEDPANFKPESDSDAGIWEYRSFVEQVRNTWGSSLKETTISQTEYRGGSDEDLVIGHRFSGKWKGKNIVINVVAAAGIDQMEIFAKSFAHDHDSVFGWLGHSRVGSGFDAYRFGSMLSSDPQYYSITSQYQLVYWGGCNSYSYYTLPFFDFKAKASGGADPKGTKGLDIIANGLPSYFSLNARNAMTVTTAMMNFDQRPSYQKIVNELEDSAHSMGINVLVAVLGDEDNQ